MILKDLFSVKNIIGIIVLILIISGSLYLYNYFFNSSNKNIITDQKKILIIIDSSKSMEKYNTKLINEINNLKNNPLNVFAVFSIMTLSKQKFIDDWNKEIYPDRIMINYFGTSQITNLLNYESFDPKISEANEILLFTSKFDNEGDIIVKDETEKRLHESSKIKIIKFEN